MANQLKVIDFMRIRLYTSAVSIIFVIISLLALAMNGLKLGLDFTGGTQLEIQFDRPANLDQIRDVLDEKQLKSPVAVFFGSEQEVMIRTQDQVEVKAREQIAEMLSANKFSLLGVERPSRDQEGFASVLVLNESARDNPELAKLFPSDEYGSVEFGVRGNDVLVLLENSIESVFMKRFIHDIEVATGAKIQLRSSEFVGPQIGDELRDQGGLGLLVAFALVFLYVAVQFQWKFSVGAIVGLVHNVVVTLGVFAIFQWDFDLTVLAAILAIIGYTINDTIVIYDRIRENFRILRKMSSFDIINISITQTLGRTIMTSMSVYIVLLCLYFIAGETLQGFAVALIIGIVAGTYSSVYICANITAALGVTKEDLMPKAKAEDGTELDEIP